MNKHKFKIIEGNNTGKKGQRIFISSYITDTRLMGVLAMHIHWKVNGTDQHQFFYFDVEEYGFDTYKGFFGSDQKMLDETKAAIMGGLGANYVDISEKEAEYIVSEFFHMNISKNISLPEPQSEYRFLVKENAGLNESEKIALMKKMCTPLLSPYHLINYYLMRVYAKDEEAVRFLSEESKIPDFGSQKPCTLLKNTIEEFSDDKGRSYVCESLLEDGYKYRIVVSEIHINESAMRVKEARIKSSFEVTPIEASLMMSRSEYITVYEINEYEDFEEEFSEMKANAMKNIHENGRLFIEFNPDNSHVNRRIFLLSEDIYGVYYISDYGQLIVAAYSEKDIGKIERELMKSSLNRYIMLNERLEFKESILYEFIQSGYEDFYDFLLDI